jgi:hypothetical protein
MNGSVKFATVTMTSETGDIEQQLVPVPFTKEFFPRAGWIVACRRKEPASRETIRFALAELRFWMTQ